MDPHCEWLFEQFVLFKRFDCMPEEGGLFDQPNILIQAFTACQNALDKDQAIKDAKSKHDLDKAKREGKRGSRNKKKVYPHLPHSQHGSKRHGKGSRRV